MTEHLPEADWKRLQALEKQALERYCARVLEAGTDIIRDAGRSNHERYLRLYDLIEERNRVLAVAFDNLRRSTGIQQLAAWIRLDLPTREELGGFSRDTIDRAELWAG